MMVWHRNNNKSRSRSSVMEKRISSKRERGRETDEENRFRYGISYHMYVGG